jgi:glycosyltransferase involved in cell wall biosynthesis
MIETSNSIQSPAVGPDQAPAVAGGRRLRIALAHDWLCGYRGGEAVLERIAALAEREHEVAGLYTMFDDGRPLSPAVDRLRAAGLVRASGLNRLPDGPGRLRRWLLPLYPWAVAELSLAVARAHAESPIDLVLSTSSAAIKGLMPPAGVPHLCYCHAPARYVWSRTDDYAGGLRGLGLRLMGSRFRAWDARTAAHVTEFLANSTHTAGEIARVYRRPARVVFPPVRTGFFTPPDGGSGNPAEARPSVSEQAESRGATGSGGTFWLVVSALEPYKRIDLAIAAAALAGAELVIAGTGTQRSRLEHLAQRRGGAVRFLGRIDDEELRRLYRSARLLIFPQVEDFGIVAAEALACGLPVVARAKGGALDILEDGVTGSLFEGATAEAVAAAAARVPQREACAAACRARALRFSEAAFDDAMRCAIRQLCSAQA